jgi:hypothetical protein
MRSFTKDELAAHKKFLLMQLEDYFELHPREYLEPEEAAISYLKAMGRGFVESCLANPSRLGDLLKLMSDIADAEIKDELLREGRLPH